MAEVMDRLFLSMSFWFLCWDRNLLFWMRVSYLLLSLLPSSWYRFYTIYLGIYQGGQR